MKAIHYARMVLIILPKLFVGVVAAGNDSMLAAASCPASTCRNERYLGNAYGIVVPVYMPHFPVLARLLNLSARNVADVASASFLVVTSQLDDKAALLDYVLPPLKLEERGMLYCVESIHAILDHFNVSYRPADFFISGEDNRFVIQTIKKM